MAPLMAMSMPVVVSPIFMLETSMATIGVSSCIGLSCIVLSFSFVCPRKTGVISSAGLMLSSLRVSYGWKSAVSLFCMFFMLRRLSSMNRVGKALSSVGVCGKLYLLGVGVYCVC